LPGIFVKVKRSESIELVCQTPGGQEVKIKAGGLTARIFQHELDHLNGKLIIDRLNLLEKFKLRKHLNERTR
ncbi:MAG: peptide deformylase, partial [Patescibacteria group bacterium]